MERDCGFFVDRPGIIYITETVCLSVHASSDVAGSLWAGIRDLPPRHGCDLLAMGGDLRPTRASSILHYLIAPSAADGFLAWRSRGGEDCRDFFQRFNDRHLVYLSTAHSDKSVETIANGPGVQALIAHLAQVHGCRKIAYLSGPENHNYAKQRYQAYQDGLRDSGLTFDARRVTPHAAWEQDSGAHAIHLLFDERGLRAQEDIDAIVCSSDQLAMGALQALRQRGVRVPEEILLAGFNNVREARTMIPSLTTVAMPFQQQSRRALLRLLHEMGVVSDPPSGTQPAAYMVLGESCGCGNPYLARLYGLNASLNQNIEKTRCSKASLQASLLAYLQQMLPHHEAQQQADTLLASLQTSLHSGELEKVLEQVKPYIRTGYFGLTSQAFWAHFWGECRSWLTAELSDIAQLRQIEAQIDTLNSATADIYLREEGSVSLWNTKVANALRSLSVESNLVPDMAALLALLEKELQALDFDCCWLVCYDEPVVAGNLPKEGRLLLALENGQRNLLSPNGIHFPLSQIIPPGYRQGQTPGVFIAFPVMQREYEYGYIILNHSRSTDWGEMISDLVGSAIRSIRLRHELAQRTTQLEHSYRDLVGAQKRLVETDKMAALGELVAGVAHEINTPVGVGVTAVSTLMDETRTLADLVARRQAGPIPGVVRNLQESASIAMRNMERAAQLIESFKLIAVDQTRAETRTFALGRYLDDVVRSVSPRLKSGGHRVEVECPETIELTCDPSIIARILTNLMINSLQHGFENRRDGLITLRAQREHDQIILEYRDNGAGMDPSTLEKMFHPFFTTKRGRGGTGLGMHIVYNLVVTGLGGQIEASSQPGHGTAFRISFPARAPA